ncbi:MAG: pyruvate kinase, partial [Candidatus Peregrinibacteria bacterium]
MRKNRDTLFSMRSTKIIATIGPACSSPAMLRSLAEAGMNLARINLSHGKNPDRIPVIEAIRELRKEGFPIGIMFDTKGAE